MSWTVGLVSPSAAVGSQKCARSFGSLAKASVRGGLVGERENGERSERLNLQGRRFGEVGQRDVHIIKELNRNYKERGEVWETGIR